MTQENLSDRQMVITRLLNAPREKVWQAWTNPEHLKQWWGPKGFTNTFHEISIQPGGVWRFMMHGPDGVDYPNHIVFKEVVQPERLIYTHGSGLPGESDFESEITFEDRGNQTYLTLCVTFATKEEHDETLERANAIEGGNQTLDRLEAILPTIAKPLVITRRLKAPVEKVWKAWTEAEALGKWWGPKGFKIEVKHFDFRPGGTLHYSMQAGEEMMWGKFSYREMKAPHQLVWVNSFSNEQGETTRATFDARFPLEIHNTLTLTPNGEETILTLQGGPIGATEEEVKFFEGMTENMNQGFAGTFEQLDEYLAKL